MQAKHINAAYGITDSLEDDADTPYMAPTLQFPVVADLAAFSLYASIKYGARSEQAIFAQQQGRLHRCWSLTPEAVAFLTKMTQPTMMATLRNLEDEWIARAEASTHVRTRARWADLAALQAIVRTTLLRPGDFEKMRVTHQDVLP